MKKLKQFIDNLATDKKGHITFGSIVNPPIIIAFLIIGFLAQKYFLAVNFLWYGYVGVVFCCLFHYQIERWQRKTGNGKFELWDAFAGSYSALKIGLVIGTIHFSQNFI